MAEDSYVVETGLEVQQADDLVKECIKWERFLVGNRFAGEFKELLDDIGAAASLGNNPFDIGSQ